MEIGMIKKILQNSHLRATPARLAILAALIGSRNPLTESEIRSRVPTMDRVTFYRNIRSLLQADILKGIVAESTTVRYILGKESEIESIKDDCVHFFCTTCHSFYDLEEKPRQYAVPAGFRKKECDVIIKGTCNRCNTSGEK